MYNLTPNEKLKFIPVILSIEDQVTSPKSMNLALNFTRFRGKKSSCLRRQAHDIVCYICHTPDIPGKLDVQKATKLGVPKGPLFSTLILHDCKIIFFEQMN